METEAVMVISHDDRADAPIIVNVSYERVDRHHN